MNIVISDTTALIIFAKSNTLSLLDNLFEEIYIPKAVHDELNFKDDIVRFRIDRFNKITLKEISDFNILENVRRFNIDKGEIEAIALALELNLQLIIDEKKGRRIALKQGLRIVGILGILIENYRKDFISFEEAHYYFELVKKNGLRMSEELEKVFYIELKKINRRGF